LFNEVHGEIEAKGSRHKSDNSGNAQRLEILWQWFLCHMRSLLHKESSVKSQLSPRWASCVENEMKLFPNRGWECLPHRACLTWWEETTARACSCSCWSLVDCQVAVIFQLQINQLATANASYKAPGLSEPPPSLASNCPWTTAWSKRSARWHQLQRVWAQTSSFQPDSQAPTKITAPHKLVASDPARAKC
jgi:hypothetical protein